MRGGRRQGRGRRAGVPHPAAAPHLVRDARVLGRAGPTDGLSAIRVSPLAVEMSAMAKPADNGGDVQLTSPLGDSLLRSFAPLSPASGGNCGDASLMQGRPR